MSLFSRHAPRPFVGFVLLLAILAQALIPSGFMPGKSRGAQTTMVICTTHGTKTVSMDAPSGDAPFGQPLQKKESPSHHNTCAYAPVTAYGFAPVSPALPAAPTVAEETASRADGFFVQYILTKPWHAQGPPAAFI